MNLRLSLSIFPRTGGTAVAITHCTQLFGNVRRALHSFTAGGGPAILDIPSACFVLLGDLREALLRAIPIYIYPFTGMVGTMLFVSPSKVNSSMALVRLELNP